MAFTEEEKEKIFTALKEKALHPGPCPICGNRNWIVGDAGYVVLPVQERMDSYTLGGPSLPCISLACSKCGNTQLLNTIILGLGDLLKKKEEPKKTEK